jgi:hypothetical protein
MGIAVWIAVGCNVYGFYAAAPLRPEVGWLYASGMHLGAEWACGLCIYSPCKTMP